MKISVIGCGYLGAVHAAGMAKIGHEVVGIDVDQAKVDSLNAARAPFFEPGFDELLSKVSDSLSFSTDMSALSRHRSLSRRRHTTKRIGRRGHDLCERCGHQTHRTPQTG